jgi:broad specificity phosphatase PhoE
MTDTDELQKSRRNRRRQRRVVTVLGFLVISTGLAWFFESQATTTVIVTRYADRSSNVGNDPALSAAGERRARELARVLGDVDVIAGVDAIFVAPTKSSIETSVPLATLNDAPVHTIKDPDDVESLVLRILDEYKGKIVLVITEARDIQPLIAEMHGSKKLPDIEDAEYDNIYIVSIPWFGKVKTLRIRYGLAYAPQA